MIIDPAGEPIRAIPREHELESSWAVGADSPKPRSQYQTVIDQLGLVPAHELGCGSPATCCRRLTEWTKAGVFDQLHLVVLDRLGEHGRVDWSRASVDTMSVRAKRGGPRGRKSS
jgi:hypothetical protein